MQSYQNVFKLMKATKGAALFFTVLIDDVDSVHIVLSNLLILSYASVNFYSKVTTSMEYMLGIPPSTTSIL